MKGRRGRGSKQLLDALKETRGYRKLKEEALDSTLWRTGCGMSYGPVVRHYVMDEVKNGAVCGSWLVIAHQRMHLWCNVLSRKGSNYRGIICPCDSSSPINPKCGGVGMNPGFRRGRPLIERLNPSKARSPYHHHHLYFNR